MRLLKPLDSTIDAQIAEIKTLRTEIETGYLRIGAILDELNVAGYPMKVVCPRVGLSLRAAYYLIRCHHLIQDHGISKSRAIKIGWGKLKEIAAPIQDDPTSLDYWLHAAETLTCRELIAIRRGPRQTFLCTLTLDATEQQELAALLSPYGCYIRENRLVGVKAALIRLSEAVIADKVRYRVKARRTPGHPKQHQGQGLVQ